MALFATWAFQRLRVSNNPPIRQSPLLIPTDEKLEEERLEGYDPCRYYPVRYGDVFNERYDILAKLGYGEYSTVWLARDLTVSDRSLGSLVDNVLGCGRVHRFVAIKVLTNDSDDYQKKSKEREILERISSADPTHPGYRLVRTLLDSFEIAGPSGNHICLVHKPMREDLATLLRRFKGRTELAGYFVKSILKHMFLALDYLHTACHVIHTDIKPDNVLAEIENKYIIPQFLEREAANPGPQKIIGDRVIYESRSFGPLEGLKTLVLGDFGLAHLGDVPHTEDIQPDMCRAPEVIIEAEWSYSADIWNMANIAWYLFEDEMLFGGIDPAIKEYSLQVHLAEIVSYLGLPPTDLLMRGAKSHKVFDSEANFIGGVAIPSGVSLEKAEHKLEGEEKALFLDFMSSMLQWLPEKRKTAKELFDHPWLNSYLTK